MAKKQMHTFYNVLGVKFYGDSNLPKQAFEDKVKEAVYDTAGMHNIELRSVEAEFSSNVMEAKQTAHLSMTMLPVVKYQQMRQDQQELERAQSDVEFLVKTLKHCQGSLDAMVAEGLITEDSYEFLNKALKDR